VENWSSHHRTGLWFLRHLRFCSLIVVQHAIGIYTTSLGAHLGGLIVGTLLGIITLKEDKNKRNRIVDHYMRAQENEEYKKNPTFFKRIEITLRKKKCKVVAFGVGNVCSVRNLLEFAPCCLFCCQFDAVFATSTNSSDPNSDGSVNKQPDEPKTDFNTTDHQVTEIVTPEPTERTVSTPGSGALFNRTSVAGRLDADHLACTFSLFISYRQNETVYWLIRTMLKLFRERMGDIDITSI
jgi:hypothetical protein